MAGFFDTLSNDPMFVTGASMLGASDPRNSSILAALQAMQGMQKNKRQAERDKITDAMAQQKLAAYQQQVQTAASQAARQRSLMDELGPMLRGAMGGQEQPTQQVPPMQAPAPLQQQDIPPGIQPSGAQSFPVAPQPLMGQQPSPTGQQPQPGQVPQGPPQPQLDRNSHFDTKVLQKESGNKQFRAPGIPLVSPAGAVGIAQVMPATGPEAAKLAGLPWDEKRLYNDAVYNHALGKAYWNKQLQDFGNPVMADAAYNAGPARVQQAMAAAEKIGKPDSWHLFLPAETKNYIAADLKEVQATAPPPTPPKPPEGPLGIKSKSTQVMAAAALMGISGVKGASELSAFGKSLEPNNVPAGGYQQDPTTGKREYIADPVAQKKLQFEEERLNMEKQRLLVEQQKAGLLEGKQKTEFKGQQSKDKAAYEATTSAAARMEKDTAALLNNPGLDRLFGIAGDLLSPKLLGEDARNASATMETLKGKILNDTLQALKSASANGASGYGSLSEKEGETIKNMISSLDRIQSPKQARESIMAIQAYAKELQGRAKQMYSGQYREDPDAGKRTVVRRGKHQGKTVIQYSDGSIEYGN